ncbi:hypothetical protein ACWDXD_25035 [Streptomyces sp. NPDC003314]
MTTSTASRTRRIHDRAHRILFALELHPRGEWVDTSSISSVLGLSSHELRYAFGELQEEGRIEMDRRRIRSAAGRPTYRSFYRLADQDDSEASA